MPRYWKRRARIDIVPLIDVFVTIVFFFIAFGTLERDPSALPVNLPGSRTAPPAAAERLVVALNERGEYLVEGRRVAPEEVSALVGAAVAKNPDLQVILAPAGSVAYEFVVAGLDLIRAGGVERPALGVRRREE